MGEVFVYDHLPHGWIHYEGKTYIKTKGSFKEIKLDDLFPRASQKEFLRSYCENSLKKDNTCNYFQGTDPLRDHLDQELIKIFVVDHESLILVFQPYAVGGFADGPFTIKIPFTELIGKWQAILWKSISPLLQTFFLLGIKIIGLVMCKKIILLHIKKKTANDLVLFNQVSPKTDLESVNNN